MKTFNFVLLTILTMLTGMVLATSTVYAEEWVLWEEDQQSVTYLVTDQGNEACYSTNVGTEGDVFQIVSAYNEEHKQIMFTFGMIINNIPEARPWHGDRYFNLVDKHNELYRPWKIKMNGVPMGPSTMLFVVSPSLEISMEFLEDYTNDLGSMVWVVQGVSQTTWDISRAMAVTDELINCTSKLKLPGDL